MYRRKVMVAAIAAFAIGVAFAAQPTSRAEWSRSAARIGSPWTPGANMLMSAHEPGLSDPMPPR
jgi:hypothetical protein